MEFRARAAAALLVAVALGFAVVKFPSTIRRLEGRADANAALPRSERLLEAAYSLDFSRDFVLTAESLGGANPPVPSLADAFYLGFYPLAYVAVVLFIRGATQKLTTSSWLDGAVASLGTAAVCAAFAFERVLRLAGGNPSATATNLAYPIGDVLLLSLIMGGSTVMSGRRDGRRVVSCSSSSSGGSSSPQTRSETPSTTALPITLRLLGPRAHGARHEPRAPGGRASSRTVR